MEPPLKLTHEQLLRQAARRCEQVNDDIKELRKVVQYDSKRIPPYELAFFTAIETAVAKKDAGYAYEKLSAFVEENFSFPKATSPNKSERVYAQLLLHLYMWVNAVIRAAEE